MTHTQLPLGRECLSSSASLDAAYEDLRSRAGAHATDLGLWVCRYADCQAALTADTLSSNVHGRDNAALSNGNLLFLDSPEHTVLRKTVARALPRADRSFRQAVATTCDQVLDGFADHATIDVVSEFAQPVAASTAAHILGWHCKDTRRFGVSLNALRGLMDPLADDVAKERGRALSVQLMHGFARALTDRDALLPHGFLVRLESELSAQGGSEPFVIAATALMLAHASYENTANLIAHALRIVLSDRNLRRSLVEETDNFDLIDDLLRLCSPAHVVVRKTTTDTCIGGVAVPPEQLVFVMLGSANNDLPPLPRSTPSNRRAASSHLAFGVGPHACLGAPLARDEARITLERFCRRFPNARLEPTAEQWRASITMRGLDALLVQLES